jgi:tetraacyldisaccharide 4'-kinase
VRPSVPDVTLLERAWFGRSATGALLRLVLTPAETIFRVAVGLRGAAYDHGLARTYLPGVPALSVGNLSVGGTGKTPVAAWFARRLREAGGHPAIVLRGYGGDEPLVHRALNPVVPVVIDADRVAGARTAVSRGADCLVLDDAFQHRRIARAADVVLVSADRWTGSHRLLPAGPWREPLSALGRATLILVTRKAVDETVARSVADQLAHRARTPVATVALAIGALSRGEAGDEMAPEALAGRRVLAISAVGDPGSYERQLESAGARVRAARFPDHHRFTAGDADTLADGLAPDELAVCTLKDHVKLAPLWPRAATALWYVSQRVAPESGASAIDQALDAVLRARIL